MSGTWYLVLERNLPSLIPPNEELAESSGQVPHSKGGRTWGLAPPLRTGGTTNRTILADDPLPALDVPEGFFGRRHAAEVGLAGRHIRPGCATGAYGAPRTFQVQVTPNTSYNVRVYIGDRSYLRDSIMLSLEGGAEVGPITTNANVFTTRVLTVMLSEEY